MDKCKHKINLNAIDKNMTLAFGALVFTLMLTTLVAGGYYYQQVVEEEENQLTATLTQLLGDAIHRISFSGRYHARLLVEDFVRIQPRILYIIIVDRNDRVIAHSDPSFNDKTLNDVLMLQARQVFNGVPQVIQSSRYQNKHSKDITIPYVSGYDNQMTGIIRVGVSVQEAKDALYQGWLMLGALIFMLSCIAIVITHKISHYLSRPIKQLALQFQGILDHSPLIIAIIDCEEHILESSKTFQTRFGGTEKDFKHKTLRQVTSEGWLIREKATGAISADEVMREHFRIGVQASQEDFFLYQFPIALDEQGAPVTICVMALDITERKRAEDALQLSKERLQLALDATNDGLWDWNLITGLIHYSSRWFDILGYSVEELHGFQQQAWQALVKPDDFDEMSLRLEQHLSGNRPQFEAEFRMKTKENGWRWILGRGKVVARDEQGIPLRVVGTITDITLRRNAEETVRRAQKMDAIGQLSGGIAHDFNNLLGIITGNLELLKERVGNDQKLLHRIATVQRASHRGADLIRQMLAFSRNGESRKTPTNINSVIRSVDSLIRRAVTPEVEVDVHLCEGLWMVKVDAGGLEDILLNMANNARDAMPKGGKLTIETSNQTLKKKDRYKVPNVVPGDYAQLVVSDTGEGMSEQVIEHIFEPFYTTKPEGKGTGLGMSMVYGFVTDAEGYIKIYSTPGLGSTIRIYLPRTASQDKAVVPARIEQELPEGNEAILVVDDEPDLLQLAIDYLEILGYRTYAADNGIHAVQLLTEYKDIALLFSDVVMPGGMDGYTLAEQAIAINPDIKVLLTSGYTTRVEGEHDFKRVIALLDKPYTHATLAQQIRVLLGQGLAVSNVDTIKKDHYMGTTARQIDEKLPEDFSALCLPAKLHRAFQKEVEVNHISAIEEILVRIAQLGPEEQRLAGYIEGLLSDYDTTGIQKIWQGIATKE